MSLRWSWSTHGCEYLFCRARTKQRGQSTGPRTCHFFPSASLFKIRTNSGESGSVRNTWGMWKKNLQLQDAIGFNTPTKTYVWSLIHSPESHSGASLKEKLGVIQGRLKMWENGPSDLLALVLLAMWALCSWMTSGRGNRSERCCLFQVWRAVRLVWKMQEISCKNWFIHLICVQIRSCWEMEWANSPGTLGEGRPRSGPLLPQQWKESSLGKANLSSHSSNSLSPRWETYQGPSDYFILWYFIQSDDCHRGGGIPGDGSIDI